MWREGTMQREGTSLCRGHYVEGGHCALCGGHYVEGTMLDTH